MNIGSLVKPDTPKVDLTSGVEPIDCSGKIIIGSIYVSKCTQSVFAENGAYSDLLREASPFDEVIIYGFDDDADQIKVVNINSDEVYAVHKEQFLLTFYKKE